MSFYKPNQVPIDPAQLPGFFSRELANIALAKQQADQYFLLDPQYKEPSKKRTGMIVFADGTTWNPGSGEGVYVYRGAAWHFLG